MRRCRITAPFPKSLADASAETARSQPPLRRYRRRGRKMESSCPIIKRPADGRPRSRLTPMSLFRAIASGDDQRAWHLRRRARSRGLAARRGLGPAALAHAVGTSLRSQEHHRVGGCRAAGGPEARGSGDSEHRRRRRSVGERIACRHAVHNRRYPASKRSRDDETGGNAGRRQQHAASQDLAIDLELSLLWDEPVEARGSER
jgi:hypothetical protein